MCRESSLPTEYVPELQAAAERAGLEWADFKLSDNTCKPHPKLPFQQKVHFPCAAQVTHRKIDRDKLGNLESHLSHFTTYEHPQRLRHCPLQVENFAQGIASAVTGTEKTVDAEQLNKNAQAQEDEVMGQLERYLFSVGKGFASLDKVSPLQSLSKHAGLSVPLALKKGKLWKQEITQGRSTRQGQQRYLYFQLRVPILLLPDQEALQKLREDNPAELSKLEEELAEAQMYLTNVESKYRQGQGQDTTNLRGSVGKGRELVDKIDETLERPTKA